MNFVNISDYNYELPDSKIPDKPLPNRDESKLLLYKNENISIDIFNNIAGHVPENALMIFNNTKVFPARLHFIKDTGSQIEVFCLENIGITTSLLTNSFTAVWKVMVGNLKRWKSGKLIHLNKYFDLTIELLSRQKDTCEVKFEWKNEPNFYAVLEQIAELPLPPYMNRKADESDKNRYQTVYAQYLGSVAAPTAGLHFTTSVLHNLKSKGIHTDEITLHVGTGTFKPVKTDNAAEHEMHSEKFSITIETIENIMKSEFVIAVGTTSMRLIESLYWLGIKNKTAENELQTIVKQWDAYQLPIHYSTQEGLQFLIDTMEKHKLSILQGATQIYILPGYNFKICKGIVTNFHQPKSTLLLLISAFIGENWKKVYQYALENNFRFLSYGDSSLLLPNFPKI